LGRWGYTNVHLPSAGKKILTTAVNAAMENLASPIDASLYGGRLE
jgi:hypothetical protein